MEPFPRLGGGYKRKCEVSTQCEAPDLVGGVVKMAKLDGTSVQSCWDDLYPNSDASPDQMAVLKHVQDADDRGDKVCCLVYGVEGSGKSCIIRTLSEFFKRRRVVVWPCAFTGIAAVNIDGRTVHSLLHLNPKMVADKRRSIATAFRDRAAASYARKQGVGALIIDEASTINARLWSCIKTFVDTALPMHVLCFGDPGQLAPVGAPSGYRITNHHWVKCFDRFKLNRRFRCADSRLNEFLDFLRNPRLPPNEVVKGVKAEALARGEALLVNSTDAPTLNIKPEFFKRGGVVACLRNELVKEVNAQAARCIGEGSAHSLTFTDVERVAHNWADLKRLQKLPEPFEKDVEPLQIRLGQELVVMVNQADREVLNGTRGVFRGFSGDTIDEFHGWEGFKEKKTLLLELPGKVPKFVEKREFAVGGIRHTECTRNEEGVHTVYACRCLVREQFPVKLAYALTTYKLQGQTVPLVAIAEREFVRTQRSVNFGYDKSKHLIVAVGRVRNADDLVIFPGLTRVPLPRQPSKDYEYYEYWPGGSRIERGRYDIDEESYPFPAEYLDLHPSPIWEDYYTTLDGD